MLPPRRISFILLAWFTLHGAVAAETITVQSMLQQQEKWPVWSREKTTLNISGRYEGRAARQFRLAKLHIPITSTRTTTLPSGLKAGQRMTVTGVIRKGGTRYSMEVSRIAVGRTDHERLAARIEKLGPGKPEQWYSLTEEYVSIADFYGDDFLKKQIQKYNTSAFALQRKQFAKDPFQLMALVKTGERLAIGKEQLQAIRFESVVALSRKEGIDSAKVVKAIQERLPGWDDSRATIDADLEERFLKDAVREYESAESKVRTKLHRRFFRTVRLPELLLGLKSDGSNGMQIADAITRELPEEIQEVDRVRKLFVDHRLTRIPFLTRQQFVELEGLLADVGRQKETDAAINAWLEAQSERRNNGQLDGIMATANEYRFAFERWKKTAHRDAAIDLLKRAWTEADRNRLKKEATAIAKDLESFGWSRLKNEWLTTEDISNLPEGDIELAMRDGRIEVGMKASQVIKVMGNPDRKIRVISAQLVQEIWIFGDGTSTDITVHMERRQRQPADAAVATLIAQRTN